MRSQAPLHPDAHSDGGLACTNDALLKEQRECVRGLDAAGVAQSPPSSTDTTRWHARTRRAITAWLASMGRKIFTGNFNLISTPFPVVMFEPRCAPPGEREPEGGSRNPTGRAAERRAHEPRDALPRRAAWRGSVQWLPGARRRRAGPRAARAAPPAPHARRRQPHQTRSPRAGAPHSRGPWAAALAWCPAPPRETLPFRASSSARVHTATRGARAVPRLHFVCARDPLRAGLTWRSWPTCGCTPASCSRPAPARTTPWSA